MNSLLAILLCTSFVVEVFCLNQEGDSCIDEDNNAGICKLLAECPSVKQTLQKQHYPKLCGYKGATDIIVCCVSVPKNNENNENKFPRPPPPSHARPPSINRVPGEKSKAKCKEYAKYSYSISKSNHKIYDCDSLSISRNFEASEREFPHMVHIGYVMSDEIAYLCAGTLISENFVLIAAQCLTPQTIDPPIKVRLGITGINDTEYRQEINIAENILYPDAAHYYHDIGLIKLEKPAELNSNVRPACLNPNKMFSYQEAVVSGWGLKDMDSELSKTLTKGIVSIVPYEQCKTVYEDSPRLKGGIDDEWMVCAAIKRGKDTCQGDSGVPLQVRIEDSQDLKCMYSILGVTSFGKRCGNPNSPSVYMRVSYFVKWIEDTVWPV